MWLGTAPLGVDARAVYSGNMLALRSAALIALGGSMGALVAWLAGAHGFWLYGALAGIRLLVMPVLFLALCLDSNSIRVPMAMRPMALLGLFALGLTWLSIAADGALGSKSVRVLTQCVADMLLLVVLYRAAGQATPASRPSSNWLRWSSWVAVAAYGVLFASTIVDVVWMPGAVHLRAAASAGGALTIPYVIASSLTRS